MCDHNRCALLHNPIDGPLNKLIGLSIDRACCFIKYQYLRVKCQRTGKRNKLFLADRQSGTAFPQFEIVRVRQMADELIGTDLGRGPANAVVADFLTTEPDVIRDRTAEQENVLQHDGERGPQVFQVPIANIDTID